MGVIIVDGLTAIQFKGPLSNFSKAIRSLLKLEEQFNGLKIETIPLPENAGIRIEMKFADQLSDFEKVVVSLENLQESAAIEIVPLPESPAIGTWPTPEKPSKSICWTINFSVKKSKS